MKSRWTEEDKERICSQREEVKRLAIHAGIDASKTEEILRPIDQSERQLIEKVLGKDSPEYQSRYGRGVGRERAIRRLKE